MKKAFTLAEALLALTIIGIITAMTVPTVIFEFAERSYIATLQATHKDLQNAIKFMLMNERTNDVTDSSLFSSDNQSEFTSRYIKAASTCSNISECFGTNTSISSGSQTSTSCSAEDGVPSFSFQMGSGAAVTFCPVPFNSSAAGRFLIDVNSKAKPNKYGRDVFSVEIMPNGTLGLDPNVSYTITENNCKTDTSYEGLICFGLLQQNNWKSSY